MTWPLLPPSCVVADVADATVIFDQRSGAMLVADPLGAFLAHHRHLFGGFDDAVAALADAFDEQPSAIVDGLRQFSADVAALVRTDDASGQLPAPRPPAGPPSGDPVAVWRFDAVGHALEVTCHDRRIGDALGPLLAALPRTVQEPIHRFGVWDDHGFVIAQDGELFSEPRSLPDAVADVITAITAVTMFASHPTVLAHAAAVGGADGVIVMGGGSNQGKSSTTVQLMEQGFGYVTDEIVSLDPVGGWVSGLARPIGLEGPMREIRPHLRPSWLEPDAHERRWPVAPHCLGQVVEGAPLRLFVVLEFVDSGPTRVEQLDVLTAMAAVGALTYNRREITATTLVSLGELFGRTRAVRVRHSGAARAAAAVREEYDRVLAGALD